MAPLAVAWFVAIGNAVNDLSVDLAGIILVVGLLVVTGGCHYRLVSGTTRRLPPDWAGGRGAVGSLRYE